ncbi:hypothetical protein A2Z67_04970 [Candidatus Woesebacteria bacterium RBG_13_36_22]|uniref:Uncharacterized protein n=1 Tax=Candidatus Woesebacteria bacterium RBG_13_36_22 TaxID=1802478 RepID=A0A1F7X305_9BACT|nr:MAG: hypothetical protein A2Z67_04970 [Candidatus Woesebacteria bacterium RBG_13_36_22]
MKVKEDIKILKLTWFPKLLWTKCEVCKKLYKYCRMWHLGCAYEFDSFICTSCAKNGEEAYRLMWK